jgi:outer membrane immunogenic protein
MKRIAIIVAAMAAIGTPALAADMAVKAPPAPLPEPVATWTGFYVGVNVGWDWQRVKTDYQGIVPGDIFASGIAAGALPASLSQNANGVLGGATLGYNVQSGSFVYGIEGDVMGMNLSATNTITTSGILFFPTLTTATTTTTDWLATVRARVGMLVMPRALLYATGGAAIGHVKGSASITPSGTSTCANNFFCSVGSGSDTQVGWAAGAGAEYMLAAHWTVKIEYLHYDLGNFRYTINEASTFPTFVPFAGTPNVGVNTKVSGDVVRAGVNLKF